MLGADIDLGAWDSLPLRAVLFGEAQGRVIVSSGQADRVLEIAARNGVPARVIGMVTELARRLYDSDGWQSAENWNRAGSGGVS